MTGSPSSAACRASTATAAGRSDTRLVVIRGNSASGKSSVAQSLRGRFRPMFHPEMGSLLASFGSRQEIVFSPVRRRAM
ncbi:hypothetical protein ACWEQI_16045, partial [Streptomyces coelicoflavus]